MLFRSQSLIRGVPPRVPLGQRRNSVGATKSRCERGSVSGSVRHRGRNQPRHVSEVQFRAWFREAGVTELGSVSGSVRRPRTELFLKYKEPIQRVAPSLVPSEPRRNSSRHVSYPWFRPRFRLKSETEPGPEPVFQERKIAKINYKILKPTILTS